MSIKNTNVVILRGNLTKDCEVSSTAGEHPTTIVKFRVANNDFEEHTNYIDCVWFGVGAYALAPYLMKGVKVIIVGSLNYSEWNSKDGKRSKLEVKVSSVELLSWPEKKTADDCPF